MDLINLYQKIISDYSKITKNNKQLDNANYIERGHNPSCGDDITILVHKENDNIVDISYIGQGCAISIASTNMMIEILKNKNINESKYIINNFFEMIKKEELDDKYKEILGDVVLLHITYNMPARIKCATLSWHSLKIILNKGENYVENKVQRQ